ncbi:MAG TPA: YggT family protein, partial [Denitromonas sp.]|nr:YggT family protein [Denitromonas sp.]
LDGNPAALLLGACGVGLVGLLKMMVYLVIGIVLISAVFSWVNPHAPMAPLFYSLSAPFLRPLRKVIPPIANVDISPMVLLLLLQVVLMLLSNFAAGFSGMMFSR